MGLKPRLSPWRQIRLFALSLPESHEDFPWGEVVIKVNQRVFVFMGRDKGADLSISVKLPSSGASLLSMPFAKPTGYGLGKSGWVSISSTVDEPLPVELVHSWVIESYRAIAPKRCLSKMP